MKILIESDPESMPGVLDEAWRRPATFALLPARTPVSENWVRERLQLLPPSMAENHFALLSSGSTGKPVLVVGSRARAEQLVRILHHHQSSEPVESTPLILPLSYCYAFVNQWLWARVFDRKLLVTNGIQYPGTLERTLRSANEAMLCLVGAQVPLLLRHFDGADFPSVIRLHFAGGPFPGRHLKSLRGLFPKASIFNNYGCIEAMPRISVTQVGQHHDPVNIGHPLPGIELETGADGELMFRSSYGAVAFCDDDGVRTVSADELVPTGDRARRMDDGSWRLDGRVSETFKRFGEKISLSIVLETVHEAWSKSAACYREPDPSGEPGYVLVLEAEPMHEDVNRLLASLQARHPRTHWPLRIESVPKLPLSRNGKVDVNRLARSTKRTVHWSLSQ
jgi:long-chain acyl-CoA synthetase